MSVEIFEEVVGKTLVSISSNANPTQTNYILYFIFDDGTIWEMRHHFGYSEKVWLEDVTGNEQDLIGHPLLMAESVASNKHDGSWSETWTYYKFATVKGYVEYCWCGESNGSYSEDVAFYQVKKEDMIYVC